MSDVWILKRGWSAGRTDLGKLSRETDKTFYYFDVDKDGRISSRERRASKDQLLARYVSMADAVTAAEVAGSIWRSKDADVSAAMRAYHDAQRNQVSLWENYFK